MGTNRDISEYLLALFAPSDELAAPPRDPHDPREACKATHAIFTRTQLRLLSLLFGQPDRYFSLTALIKRSGCGSGATQRELARLRRGGLVEVLKPYRRKYYRADATALIHAELVALFRKTTGVAQPLREALAQLHGIEAAFACRGEPGGNRRPSPLQLVLAARDFDAAQLAAALARAASALDRQIEPIVLLPEELQRQPRGWFLEHLLGLSPVWVLGDERALAAPTRVP